jgi:replicative DNA helicase
MAHEPQDPLDEAVERADTLYDASQAPGPRPIGAIADRALSVMRLRASGADLPVRTPWASVNEALWGGLYGGLYVLVSGTGVGKTQWALQVAIAEAQAELERSRAGQQYNEAVAPRPVVYVGLELGEVDVVARVLGLLSDTPWSSLAYGRDLAAFETARPFESKLRDLPLHVEVAPPRGWGHANIDGLIALRPRLVVLDFLQLVRPEGREDTRQAMSRIAYAMRAMARDHNTCVLALSSTSRANYSATSGGRDEGGESLGQGDPARYVGLGKESGDIEFAADGVFVLLNEPRVEGEIRRTSWLAIAKARGGLRGSGWVRMLFDGSSFEESSSPTTMFAPGVGRR